MLSITYFLFVYSILHQTDFCIDLEIIINIIKIKVKVEAHCVFINVEMWYSDCELYSTFYIKIILDSHITSTTLGTLHFIKYVCLRLWKFLGIKYWARFANLLSGYASVCYGLSSVFCIISPAQTLVIVKNEVVILSKN